MQNQIRDCCHIIVSVTHSNRINQCSIFGLDFTLFFFIYQGKIWVQNIKAIISLGPQLSPDFRLGEAIGFCEQDKAACFQILFAFIAKGSPLTRMRGGCVGTQLDRMWRLVEFCFKKDICLCEQDISQFSNLILIHCNYAAFYKHSLTHCPPSPSYVIIIRHLYMKEASTDQ